ncbi:MAG TPA: NAD-dependent DNA ligase LigA, partial [Candidatus Marinimicrobia bacterium]|nr:NAD-dependent DNA ligase LigA [Candidatus Neomarinimicrobiota bacterium]
LEKHYKGSIKKFQQTTVEELETIDEIGPTIAQTVTQFWQDTNNRIMVQNCLNRGVSLAEIKRKMDQPLTGQIFVFTGSLEKFTRQEAKIMVEHLGGKTTDSVSKKTSYVVAGPGGGSKLKKAKELGSSIISENEFLEMLR